MSQVPVAFTDVGKGVSDLLGKDYPTGAVRLEVKTTASNGVTFTVNGAKDNKSGAIGGDLRAKYADKKHGLTINEAWTTSNVLSASCELQDTIAAGMKLALDGSILPASGQQNARIGAEYKQDYLFTRASLDLFRGPILSGDMVFGADGLLVGGEVAYDVKSASVIKYNAALGYAARDYAVTLHANNALSVFSASYWHKVNSDLEAGAKAVWDRKLDATSVGLEVGTKFALDMDTSIKAKINNAGMLGLGYSQNLRPGVKLSLAGAFDTARLSENVHKLGLSITLEN